MLLRPFGVSAAYTEFAKVKQGGIQSLSMDAEIKALFKVRDKAVRTQNRELFLSTQLAEVEHLNSLAGYFDARTMVSEVLAIHPKSDIEVVVFVKEMYVAEESDPTDGFVVYFLVRTTQGWKIYHVH